MKVMLACCLLLGTVSTSLAGTASTWHSFGFNGNGFASGAASGVMVRDGYLPAPAGASVPEDPLPAGDGAVALFCYQQRSGGKIKRAFSSFVPMAGVAVTVTGNSFTIAGRTDETGYLILALPPGRYQLIIAGLPRRVTVERGKTALVAVRGSKGMVD